jgi:hypothetical protein
LLLDWNTVKAWTQRTYDTDPAKFRIPSTGHSEPEMGMRKRKEKRKTGKIKRKK